MIKKIIMLLMVPFIVMAQGYRKHLVEYSLFSVTDTLFASGTLTSGWVDIGFMEGATNLSFQFQNDSADDSSTAGDVRVEAQLKDSGFWSSVLDDSVSTSPDGWIYIGEIDSVCLADSVGWILPLADQAWWNRIDLIRFKLTAGTVDSFAVNKATLKGW